MSSIPKSDTAILPARALAPLAAMLLGAALLFLAGFAEVDALHNGAHDARHSAALPCH
ncbi:MAG TPA: CbtB-domain containing protein [Usitatibacter sp.]|nr:CbtB-domain containing protein [Usitatibacter sp.]